jgi:HEPN domain-containing protein
MEIHLNSIVLNILASSATHELQLSLKEMTESMKILEPHITKARYPIRRGLELLAPNKFYTKETADKALTQAKKVVTKVKTRVI